MARESPSERLERKVGLFGAALREARREFWDHPAAARMFPGLLFRMHCEARSTVHLLETAAVELERAAASDPVAPRVRAYFRELAAEERGHDDWLLEALEALGVPRADVRARIPPATVAAVVGAQYYWMYHHHPIALLGFVKIVEGEPSTAAQIAWAVENKGLPPAAFRYHLAHVELEPLHNAKLDRLLDSLPLSPEHEAIIGVSAARTAHLLAQSTRELIALHQDANDPRPEAPLLA